MTRIPNHPPAKADIAALKARAKHMRNHMLVMARGPGQG
jgi:transketolase